MSEFNFDFNYQQTCRTCLKQEKDVISLTPIFDRNVTPIEITNELSKMKLKLSKDDRYPQSICNECVDGLMYTYTFRALCENSQITLERFHITSKPVDLEFVDVDLLSNVKIEPEPDPKLQIQLTKVILPQIVVELNQNDMVEGLDSDSEEIQSKTRVTHNCFRCGEDCCDNEELVHHEKNTCLGKLTPKCRYCNKMFGTVEILDTHLRCTHPLKKQNQICPICGKCFTSSQSCKIHVESHNEIRPYKCDICDSKFKCKNYLTRHKKIMHVFGDHECPHCFMKFKNTNKYEYHLRTHETNKKYKCKYCDKSFMLRHHYENHERIHSGIKPYLCNICGKRFRQQYYLTLHLRVHTGVRPHTCTLCGKSFAQPSSFIMHKRRHAGIRPYQCEHCGKNFFYKARLTIHLRTHTGQRPFKCDLCDNSYTQSQQLKQHKIKMHAVGNISNTNKITVKNEPEDVKLFKCSLCIKEFKFQSALAIHIKTHSEERKYGCTECDKSFKRAEHLRIHISSVHLKQKPYACDLCDKSFAQSGDRNKHRLLHTGEKPHTCPHCPKRFQLRKALTIHIKTHADVIPKSPC